MHSKKILYALAFIVCLNFLGTGKVNAQNEFCKTDQTVFEKVGNAFKALDIRKTTQNMIASAATDSITNIIANRSPQQMMECSVKIFGDNSGGAAYARVQEAINKCGMDVSTVDCSDFTQTYDPSAGITGITGGLAFNQTQTSGSLLGMANTIEGSIRTEPLPTNLAYFLKDSVKDVPFAGTVLAADVSYGYAPMISLVLEIWKTIRNIAFGVLAIVMLVTGIMIMVRKKLSAQLVVSVQYALPRIALAVVLIVFSYPIGAVLASSMKYLTDLMSGIVRGIDTTASIGGAAGDPSIGVAIALVFLGILGAAGAALPILIAVAVALLIALVLYIWVWIKAALLYLKLIVSIVFAPVSFALGAIPGNEASWKDWFKGAIANVLGYVGMITYMKIGMLLFFMIVQAPNSLLTGGTALGSTVVVLLSPGILIWILLQTIKVPGKIQAYISGDDKKPGAKKK